jgi:hypothetical protein
MFIPNYESKLLKEVKTENPDQPEFHRAVGEVIESLLFVQHDLLLLHI